MRVMKNVLIFFALFISCNETQDEYQDFVVIKSKQVDSNYEYTPNSTFKYDKDIYLPQKKIEYKKGLLECINVYKSDGILKYDRRELENDNILFKLLNAPP